MSQDDRNLSQPDAPKLAGDLPKAQKLGALRSRVQRGQPADADAQNLDAPAASSSGSNDRRLASGVRLSPADRRQVLRLLADYEDIPTVQEVIARDYPDLPIVSDRSLRTMRTNLLRLLLDLADEIEAERYAGQIGLAARGRRIAHLEYQYRRLQAIMNRNDEAARAGKRAIDAQLGVVDRQLRILEQLAAEMGDRPPIGVAWQSSITQASKNDPRLLIGVSPQASANIDESIDLLIEERQAMRDAERDLPPAPTSAICLPIAVGTRIEPCCEASASRQEAQPEGSTISTTAIETV